MSCIGLPERADRCNGRGLRPLAAPRSEATASDRSYICGFGDFELGRGAASEGLPEPAEEVESKAAKPVELEGYTEIPISCLEEGWNSDACLDDFDDAPRGIAILVDLPRDVFVPAPVRASRALRSPR